MFRWWWGLACAWPAPPGPSSTPPPAPVVATELAHYRLAAVAVEGHRGPVLRVRVTDAAGRPEAGAAIRLLVHTPNGERDVLVDPGECDDIGPERCSHPDGWFETLPSRDSGPLPTDWRIVVIGSLGEDEARLRVSP